MPLRLLLDTHILVRWLAEPKRLSREQMRAIQQASDRGEPVGVAATSLLELAMLSNTRELKAPLDELLNALKTVPLFTVLPVTCEIASEFAALPGFRDPADRAIVATARVHGLRVVTSDQRIIDSKLVPVID